MEAHPVIVADRLTRRFGDVVAVDDLTLEVYAGEIFGFLGHNGAGKTTTVRLLNGVLAPSDGSARVLGFSPDSDGPDLRRRTGVLTETPSLDERLTGQVNLEIYAELYGVPRTQVSRRVGKLLEAFGLAERAGEKVGAYSRGMKQRLALARALLHEPQILFLDEPTASLDPVAARQVHELITRQSHEQRHTVVLCTHNLVEAQDLCNRVAVLEHGRLVALGTPRDLARQLGRSLSLQVEVAPEDVAAALNLLQSKPVAVEVSREPGTIAIMGADREAIPGLVAELVAAGIGIYRVSPQEPSLEDVYFALHGEATEVIVA
jgi:ABC-2 type transport system ATP-binding protein